MHSKTSLGIVITDERISFALLAKTKSVPKLVKAGHVPTPEGCLVGGNIADPVKLARCINKMLRSKRITARQAGISLVARPHLVQIIDLPVEMPGNLGKFVESEIKHSAILLGKAHQSDYCGLSGKSVEGGKRVIVAAVEQKKLSPLIRMLQIAKIEPVSIEPASIAWTRALYDKFVATNYNCNVLFVRLSGTTITMSVFRKGALDFIRTRELPIGAEISEYPEIFSSQIRAIKQYYDVEVSSFRDEQWAAVLDLHSEFINIGQIREYLVGQFESVHICSNQDPALQTCISADSPVKEASISAIGIAMKQIANSKMTVKFDLVPQVEREKRAVRKWAFAAASFAIAIISAVALIHNMMFIRLAHANDVITDAKSNIKIEQISDMLRQEKDIESRLAAAESFKQSVGSALGRNAVHDWPSILNTLASLSPQDLCIMDIRQIGDNTLVINGKVTSHDSVHIYAGRIGSSDLFESAEVSRIAVDQNYEGLINYTIDCVLKANNDEEETVQS